MANYYFWEKSEDCRDVETGIKNVETGGRKCSDRLKKNVETGGSE